MPLFMTHASYSAAGAKGLIARPQDRAEAIEEIARAAGGRVVALYMTTGEHDVVLVCEFADPEMAVAMSMAIAASGAVSRQTTVSAWTSADFVRVAEKAAALTDAYSPPGTAPGAFRAGYV